jgi:hypothetical protein
MHDPAAAMADTPMEAHHAGSEHIDDRPGLTPGQRFILDVGEADVRDVEVRAVERRGQRVVSRMCRIDRLRQLAPRLDPATHTVLPSGLSST